MSYARVAGHRTMAFDEVRNKAFLEALQQVITPDSVVLDLGAGIGILGLLAAKAGARRVYLVEKEPVVRLARELARRNGVEDRVVVLEGAIEDVRLPEQVDLILSVFTGNLLFTEDLLPLLFLARDRWLKPGGRLLPDRAELWLGAANTAELHAEHLGRWSGTFLGLDLAAGRQRAANEIIWLPRGQWQGSLLATACLCELDLASATVASCAGTAAVNAEAAGLCHGLLGWIRLRLGDAWISTAPDAPAMHWANALLPLDLPLEVRAGDLLEMTLQRPFAGDWSWTITAPAGQRRHSEFLARLDAPETLRRLAPDYHPQPHAAGRILLQALALMDGSRSSAAIAARLRQDWPERFADDAAALDFLRQAIRHHAGPAHE